MSRIDSFFINNPLTLKHTVNINIILKSQFINLTLHRKINSKYF